MFKKEENNEGKLMMMWQCVQECLKKNDMSFDLSKLPIKDLLEDLLSEEPVENEEKGRLYEIISAFFMNKMDLSKSEAMYVTLELCDEAEEKFWSDRIRKIDDEDLLDEARHFVLSIKVHYDKLNSSQYKRTVEIYTQTDGQPSRYIHAEEVPRDFLPQTIISVRSNEPRQTFKIYPQE